MKQALENVTLKRNANRMSFVFCEMSCFWANELFAVKPFAVREIGGQFQEKFVRIRLLNWARNEVRNWKLDSRPKSWLGLARQGGTKPIEATGTKDLFVNDLCEDQKERSHGD